MLFENRGRCQTGDLGTSRQIVNLFTADTLHTHSLEQRKNDEASDEVNLWGQGQIAVSIYGEGEEIEENEEIRNTRIKMEK